MDYSHSKNILAALSDIDARKYWEGQLRKPFPKLLNGYVDAGTVSYYLNEAGLHSNFASALNLRPKDTLECRIFTFDSIKEYSAEWSKDQNRAARAKVPTARDRCERGMIADLQKLGCNAFLIDHSFSQGSDDFRTEHTDIIVLLPYIKPPSTRAATDANQTKIIPERDIEGAAIFLAYLLHKGLITEQEIIEGDARTDYGSTPSITWPAFGLPVLALAKSSSVQAKIRSLDGPDTGAGAQKIR